MNTVPSPVFRNRTLFWAGAACLALAAVVLAVTDVMAARFSRPSWLILGGGLLMSATGFAGPGRPTVVRNLALASSALSIAGIADLIASVSK